MSPSKAEAVVQHIHPLTKVDGVGRYICDGCKTEGSGRSYRCASCNYDLHEYCATCPPTLVSHLHPQHKLRLVHDRRGCDICNEATKGLFYQCEPCGVDVHPLCTQQPQKVSHDRECTNQGEVEEEAEHGRIRKRDIARFGANVAYACLTGDVITPTISYFFL
ncbi:Uncharacterized protein Rs2_17765 [Raphanus sativus]|uniref:Protein VACUOLELESS GAMETOPHYTES n=1 Tax=Raphanus sativus TaxID=3726 RepID=A0A6J0N5I6_RAPSA|nr:protein VACUOLELESS GAMETOPHYTES [Raphanus sativus]KAJ4903814.1 Uncharacterized protein Rs2_17765 [Raphanus sativus]